MVYRVFSEKKEGFDNEAAGLREDFERLLGIKGLKRLRVLNRYDAEGLEPKLFDYAAEKVFSEPQLDKLYFEFEPPAGSRCFAVEFLPGQFDQRAASAAECIQIISMGERPCVRSAKLYVIEGEISDADFEKIKKYLINPVEAREASLKLPESLKLSAKKAPAVKSIEGFRGFGDEQLLSFIRDEGLACDLDDLRLCRDYFISEQRDPTLTEIRVIDTYWSDHCRHTTFLTQIDSAEIEDDYVRKVFDSYLLDRKKAGVKKPVTLMDLASFAAKKLKAEGLLDALDESDEVNACTLKIKLEKREDGSCGKSCEKTAEEPFFLLFKNETHNHPTEIEPFGGAATCIGGAIRDPLSGRAYAYAAMRVTGAADPLLPIDETLKGKLPQRTIVTKAAQGYSSYGNQIGLATGLVDEFYHPGYAAKRMEIGAVLAAVPVKNVVRERPKPGDLVILIGGRTGRDGCGGATGSSKAHDSGSLESCGAEVQKGNAPEERKLQRLFRNPKVSRLIKKCNDFGAGGVAVAVGELAEGLEISLDAVPKKYEGLDGTELAISESQERMAVVVDNRDAADFIRLAAAENTEATVIAKVTERKYLTMELEGRRLVDISRKFLDSNGAEKHIKVIVKKQEAFDRKAFKDGSFEDNYRALVSDLNVCSKRGLSERFDSTIGAGTVLMPFGGKTQSTPIQAMVHKVAAENCDTETCSLMAYGCNPYIMEKNQFCGAYLAVVESVSKLIAAGSKPENIYLSFQEYFEKPGRSPERWGKPFAALLGAYLAQTELCIASVGGKDSMSGSFEKLDVPPTLCSFAVTTERLERIISDEFKAGSHAVMLLSPALRDEGIACSDSQKALFELVSSLIGEGKIISVFTPVYGGTAEAVFKMCLGNRLGFKYADAVKAEELFSYSYGSFVCELSGELDFEDEEALRAVLLKGKAGEKALKNSVSVRLLGRTLSKESIEYRGESIKMSALRELYENKLESVFPCNIKSDDYAIPSFSYSTESLKAPHVKCARPKALIPVFPGTNCEYDTAEAFRRAGIDSEIFIVNNLSAENIEKSALSFAKKVLSSQLIFIPGGFSGGDEPDGSGKFITSFFRNPEVKQAVSSFLDERGGLMGGICNGFQALIKLGLVPFGKILDTDESFPTLSFNGIGRHQSRLVRVKLCSDNSPWLRKADREKLYLIPVSHGEGRLSASKELLLSLAEKGQIMTQYVDREGRPSNDISVNPNGSLFAVEGLLSPDGRIFGRMGHSERVGRGLYKNVKGDFDMQLFESAAEFLRN